ncbi:PepSY domain-containing protein [Pyxidicoccus parkwayensis]|nr:PepSY domain-containing protein [Pyxidicoccus parkwaysis]
MKLIRRTHMYLGLLLFPWLLVFGISGVLFNHPNVGEDVAERALSSEQLRTLTGFEPVEPAAVARAVIAKLNAEADGSGYQLDDGFESRYSGFTVLTAPGEGVNHILILDLKDGTGSLATRGTSSPQQSVVAPFAGATVPLPEHSMAAVEAKMAGLLPKLNVEAKTPPRSSPRGVPELRFRMMDAQQRLWNVTYHLGTGKVDGRIADAPRVFSVNELLTKLHVLHHYPLDFGFVWLWALFADLTGLMIVFWAVSGLVMWWQMKPTRVLGVVSISLALGVGLVFIGGTLADLQFGNVQKRSGPGDSQQPPAMKKPTPPAATTTAREEPDHH